MVDSSIIVQSEMTDNMSYNLPVIIIIIIMCALATSFLIPMTVWAIGIIRWEM